MHISAFTRFARDAAFIFFACFAALALWACGGGGGPTDGGAGPLDGGAADGGTGPHLGTLPPLQPGDASFTLEATLQPGEEALHCKFFQLPRNLTYVRQAEIQLDPGVHHVSLFSTRYTSIPTRDVEGNTVDTRDVFPCPQSGSQWDYIRTIGAAQSAGTWRMLDLPAGVGLPLEPGAILLLNVHYVNPAPTPRRLKLTLQLHAATRAETDLSPGFFEFTNRFVLVPARGTSVARMRCPITQDVSLVSLLPHMHDHGRTFIARLVDPSGSHELFRTRSADDGTVHYLPEPLTLRAGNQLEFECSYANDTAADVVYGQELTREMCMLRGTYYPVVPALDLCAPTATGEKSSAGVIDGLGTSSCAEVLPCLQANRPPNSDNAVGSEAYLRCLLNTCPAVSSPVSALAQCQVSAVRGPCGLCRGGFESSQCRACMDQHCATQLTACRAATSCAAP